MVYSIRNGQLEASHSNHRGDVIARTDHRGNMNWFARLAYGTGFDEVGATYDRQRANTKDEEEDLNLLNEGFRYRDLETGTFLTRDPIGYGDGPNVYCYVNCNPITQFDAFGLYLSATPSPDNAQHTNFKLTASVVFEGDFTSDHQSQIMDWINTSISESWSGGNGSQSWSMNADITVAGSAADVPKDNHTIIVTATMPKGSGNAAGICDIGGSTITLNGAAYLAGDSHEKTPGHELGHSAVLGHPDTLDMRKRNEDSSYGNLMHQSVYGKGKELTPAQVKSIQNNYNTPGAMNNGLAPGPTTVTPSILDKVKSLFI